jgi:hypothetical protein
VGAPPQCIAAGRRSDAAFDRANAADRHNYADRAANDGSDDRACGPIELDGDVGVPPVQAMKKTID